ncbi:ATP-dependent DNA helicase PcrA [Candidatus Wolfebacteria bacterium]|nr:MAG: ATP-dependent DNA helicase PcrA [Candidatus Wolfebacteria bacterium]
MNYLEGLNDAQKDAVTYTEGPLLIVAGAGAGKTRTITHRILHLVKQGTAPHKILAITFTNKAANEMQERVNDLLSKDDTLNVPMGFVERPFVSTFHRLGIHIIKAHTDKLGLTKSFSIFDRDDSLRAMKRAIKQCDLDPKNYEPKKFLSIISRKKGEAISFDDFINQATGSYSDDLLTDIWRAYQGILTKEKALDFDDLLLRAVKLLQGNESVREYYQSAWSHVHIDEYQDTNKVQYELCTLLTEGHNNICVVGDADQCLLPNTKIQVCKKTIAIKNISKKMSVTVASGGGLVCESSVKKVHTRKYVGDVVTIVTKSGKKITATPNHMMFASFSDTVGEFHHYVYLMYKKNVGYRIGLVQGSRSPRRGVNKKGFLVRSNQEHADKLWILKVCHTRQEASYWETLIATKYGIPTIVFHVSGRNMLMEQKHINKIFSSIDTEDRARILSEEFNLSLSHPHYVPQGTTRGNTERGRVCIRLTLFSDKRKSLVHPWGLSRVSINTTDAKLRTQLHDAGFKTRKGKDKDWRLEITRLDYAEAEDIAKQLQNICGEGVVIVRSALLTKDIRMMFQPATNIRETMVIPVLKKGVIVEEEVVSVTRKKYSGPVYDLDIENVHNYIANDVVVHNCIYSWRGATIKNIMSFERDHPNAKTVFLKENYRSTKNILDAANSIIEKNEERVPKELITRKSGGEKILIGACFNEIEEAEFVTQHCAEMIREGTEPKEIAVLYRANFQSRILEESMLRRNVPYQVLGTRFYDRREVKDVISYIRAARNPDSFSDFERVVNVPPRGIGKVTVAKVAANKEDTLTPAMQERVRAFRNSLARIRKFSDEEKVSDTIKYVVKESGLEESLRDGTEEDAERLENIKELATLAMRYDEHDRGSGVEMFLEDVALASEQDSLDQAKKEKRNAVKMMTVHASKGLEFDHVFVVGLEDELFPHSSRDEDSNAQSRAKAEEERRLFYVAITRARHKLFLSHASQRTIYGQRDMQMPSEFLADIPADLCEIEDHGSVGESSEGGSNLLTVYWD